MSQPCTICGDPEPVHIHHEGERIEDYFVVGRGETDIEAAERWKQRALEAERELKHGRTVPGERR